MTTTTRESIYYLICLSILLVVVDSNSSNEISEPLYGFSGYIQDNNKYFSINNMNNTIFTHGQDLVINPLHVSQVFMSNQNSLLIKNQDLRMDYQEVFTLMDAVTKKKRNLLDSIPKNHETGKQDKTYYFEKMMNYRPWYHVFHHIGNAVQDEPLTVTELESLWVENGYILQSLEWWNSFIVNIETHRQHDLEVPNKFSLMTISELMGTTIHKSIREEQSKYFIKKNETASYVLKVFDTLEDSIRDKCIATAKESPSHVFELYDDINSDILQNILCRFQENNFCNEFIEKRRGFYESLHQEYKPLLLVPEACSELAKEKVSEIYSLYNVLLQSIYNVSFTQDSVKIELEILQQQQQQLALSTLFLSSLKEAVPLLPRYHEQNHEQTQEKNQEQKQLQEPNIEENTLTTIEQCQRDGNFVQSEYYQNIVGPDKQYMMYDDGSTIYRATVERVEKNDYYETLYPLFAITRNTQMLEPLWDPVLSSIQNKVERLMTENKALLEETKWIKDLNNFKITKPTIGQNTILDIYGSLSIEQPLMELSVLDLLVREVGFIQAGSNTSYNPILEYITEGKEKWLDFLESQYIIEDTHRIIKTYVETLHPILKTVSESVSSLFIKDAQDNICNRRLISTLLIHMSTGDNKNYSLTTEQENRITERMHTYQLLSKDLDIRRQFIVESLLRENKFVMTIEQLYHIMRYIIQNSPHIQQKRTTQSIARSQDIKSPMIWQPCIETGFYDKTGWFTNKDISLSRMVYDLQNHLIHRYEKNSVLLNKYLKMYSENQYMQLLEDGDFN